MTGSGNKVRVRARLRPGIKSRRCVTIIPSGSTSWPNLFRTKGGSSAKELVPGTFFCDVSKKVTWLVGLAPNLFFS